MRDICYIRYMTPSLHLSFIHTRHDCEAMSESDVPPAKPCLNPDCTGK